MGIPAVQSYRIARYIIEQKLKGNKRYPLVLMLEPLFQCNLACEGCGKTYSPRRSDQRTCGALACKRKVRSADEAARRAAAGGVAAPEGPRRKNPACREDAGS